jgi:hypothetical protein
LLRNEAGVELYRLKLAVEKVIGGPDLCDSWTTRPRTQQDVEKPRGGQLKCHVASKAMEDFFWVKKTMGHVGENPSLGKIR